jgi:tetratricopeptide (TPR) repeat protein
MTMPSTKNVYPVHQFVGDFASWIREEHDIRYCFVIGAGASRSSGIPTGASLVDGWLRTRFEQECPGAPRDDIQRWAQESFNDWPGFSWPTRASFYGRIYEWFYRDNSTGQAALRKLMRDKSPSFGYSVLAAILSKTDHKVVLTTNFDNLVRDALNLYVPDEDPFVCHGEYDARFLAGHVKRVRIVKIHGDIDRETYNASAQLEKLHGDWEVALRGIFTDHTPIFLGYGGNDPGFVRFLTEKLDKRQFRAHPIWAYRVDLEALGKAGESAPAPPGWPEGELVHQFMEKYHGLWLPIPGFDEFMLLLGHALSYESQAARIRGEGDRRAKDYERTLAEAIKALRGIPCKTWCPQLEHLATAAEIHLLGEAKRRSWDEWRVALEAAPSRVEEAHLFEEGLKELKDSPELKAFCAFFLAEEKSNDPRVDELIKEALSSAEKSAGLDSPTVLMVQYYRAQILSLRANTVDALSLAQDVLRVRKAVLGQEHPDTLRTENLVASALYTQGNYAEAERLYRRTLEARERTQGPEHPDTLSSVNNLALALFDRGNYAEAEKLNRRALEARERTLGSEHPHTLSSVNNLAIALSAQGNYAEAEKLHRRALEARERTQGPDYRDTLSSVDNLAIALSEQGNYTEAEKLHRRALEARERTQGTEHPNTLSSVNNLATVLFDQGNYAEAEEYYQLAALGFEKVLGKDHPYTLKAQAGLAEVKTALDK